MMKKCCSATMLNPQAANLFPNLMNILEFSIIMFYYITHSKVGLGKFCCQSSALELEDLVMVEV